MALVDPNTPVNTQPTGIASGYTLTFSDEFTGSSLDSTKWNTHTWFDSDSGITNYEVSGGTLKMFPTAAFVTRHLCTGGPASGFPSLKHFTQTFGFYEARLKMPIGDGCWPAWWMLNSDTGPVDGAEPEIDIMECYPGDKTGFWANSSQHPIAFESTYFQIGANQGGAQKSVQKFPGDISTAFHTYGLKWTSTDLTFYYDGVAFSTSAIVMNKAMYLLLSLQFASFSASGNGDGTTPLGNTNSYEIDYVRVWQPGAPNPYFDATTPPGVQPNGFASGYTLTMSDEFNSTSLNSKWFGFRDFGDFNTPAAFDVNASNNSTLRMWWTGNTGTDNQIFGTTGPTPFRQRYGFFEARVKCIRGRGFFPAFWLYPQSDSHSENADGQQQELDITEWFAFENGDWLVDTTNFRCKNAKFTIWTEGGGGATSMAGERYLRDFHGYDSTISTAFHTYGMRWTAVDGLQYFFDGVAQGSAIPDPWGSGSNIQLAIFLQLWWGPNGGNPTPDGNTPANSSNAMEWDYVRVWSIGSSTPPPPPPPAFSVALTDAPNDGATLSGNVHFGINGNVIRNAELLPPTNYLPRYGTFTITQGNTVGDFNWDTTALSNGAISVRISAFDQPQGVGTANEIVAMSTRTYIISNIAAPPIIPSASSTASATLQLAREFCVLSNDGGKMRFGP